MKYIDFLDDYVNDIAEVWMWSGLQFTDYLVMGNVVA